MYERILVPVDGSPTSNRGLAEAIQLAKLTGARLRLLHVVDLFAIAMGAEGGYVGDALSLLRESGEQILAAARGQVEAAGIGVEVAHHETSEGRVCDLIIEEAVQSKAELIVMGTHGRRGVRRLALGSDAEMVARMAPVPVLLVRGTAAEQ
jgi:nucleotide-binding universal stress UspA family protein